LYCKSGDIGESDDDGSSSSKEDNIYKSSREEPMLASLSDLYLELEVILVSANRSSSCSISHCLSSLFSLTAYYPGIRLSKARVQWLVEHNTSIMSGAFLTTLENPRVSKVNSL